jgi:hypothetical protein
MTRSKAERREQGLAVLQLLIVFGIAITVAAIGLPAYAARAKTAVLEQNAVTLSQQVKGILAADSDTGLDSSDAGPEFARELDSGAAGRFANPLSGSDGVVWQTSLPNDADSGAPAIWITDDPRHTHNGFSLSAAERSRLAGTLVIAFNSHEGVIRSIDVFYVDARGRRSDVVVTVAPPSP